MGSFSKLLAKVSPRRIVGGTRILLQGRPRCLKLVQTLVCGKKGIEIGGPSAVFLRWFNLPVYNVVAALDNCDFSQRTEWAEHTESFCFDPKKPCGKTYFCEGSELRSIPDHRYDFLLSSHNLEHMANPFKALKEWQRVVVKGGHLIIVLPHYARTFDHRRVPTTVEHMWQDYQQGTGEDDLTHVEEVFEAHRLNDPDRKEEQLRALLLNNHSHRMMHHHVFDEDNACALLEACGFRVLAAETQLPFHILLVAQLP